MATINPDGISIKGCTIIYAPAGQAGEYSPLATNPYRGCGHACAYCLEGGTLIQMADGGARAIRDIGVGDSVVGVVVVGNARAWNTRLTSTPVLAKVASHKRAYKVTTMDGKEVVCSADHRWLTDRGWKFTTTASYQRPHLTANNLIRKVGGAVPTPTETQEYQAGYIAGIVRGDANLAVYDYSDKRRPSGKTMGIQHRFRLALKDIPALERTRGYLSARGIETTLFVFASDGGPMRAIGTTSPARVEAIRCLTVPRYTREWLRGWLAGIFDAEGSHGAEALRIANSDAGILGITDAALREFGFDYARDRVVGRDVEYVRVCGGRTEEMRFWQITNPAIKRKFSLEGRAVCDSSQVVSIEPLDETVEMFDIMTGTETFVANGLVSHNCYVPQVLFMDRAEFDAGATPRDDFAARLLKDARKYQAAGITEQVMLSFTTDPYHLGDTALTRHTLETPIEHGMGFCTLTKGGARALRDLDLFRRDRDAFASTLTSLDADFSQRWERNAALPQDRIDTLRTFHDLGIFTWVSLEPVLDTEATKEIIRQTHGFVDLYKVGRVNYVGLTRTTDWERFTGEVLEVLAQTGAAHYIKKDLQPYLPAGYPNLRRVQQHHGAIVEATQ